MVTDLLLLEQRQRVGEQSHPEAPGGDLCRHEGEQQLGVHGHDEAFTQENQPSPQLYMPMPEVRNLDLVLPLTSTPWEEYGSHGTGQTRSRLSDVRPRGLLPMEFEDSPLGRPGPSRIRNALAKRARGVRKAIFNETDSSDD